METAEEDVGEWEPAEKRTMLGCRFAFHLMVREL